MTENPLQQPQTPERPVDADSITDAQLTLLGTLADRWDEFEGLLEGTAARAQLDEKINAYLEAQNIELKQLKTIRTGVSAFVAVFVVCVAFSLFMMVFNKWPTLRQLDPITATSIVVGSFSSIVILLVALIRGSYRLATDRNKESELPSGLNTLIQAITENASN